MLIEEAVSVDVDNRKRHSILVPIIEPNVRMHICEDYKSTINKCLQGVK